jgi:hypothetical protein
MGKGAYEIRKFVGVRLKQEAIYARGHLMNPLTLHVGFHKFPYALSQRCRITQK